MPPLPLALTMGDPAGIGLDLAATVWSRRNHIAGLPPFVYFGNADTLLARARLLDLELPVALIDDPAEASALFPRAVPVIDAELSAPARPGRPDPANAGAVIASIEAACAAVQAGRATAIVTNPIAKATLYAAGFTHPGHTEFLAAIADRNGGGPKCIPVMLLAADELRVVPLTVHIALAAVPAAITPELICRTARITAAALRRDFGIKAPHIAFAGLNPHAGERGALGREEIDIIIPAIEQLAAEGLQVSGPHPGDTMFHSEARTHYDAAIAMYHDQALIPLKTLAFDRGVNITLGLPFVRTSPDHGTAFDIAGSGRAKPDSLIAALAMAAKLSQARRDYDAGVTLAGKS